MTSAAFAQFMLQITIMLACAVAFGHLMRRIGQPAVLGEMVGGIVLGPTIFGAVAPELWQGIFRADAGVTSVRDATIKLGMLFFLFVAGLEIDVSDLRRLGKRAVAIGLTGTVLPILIGVALIYLLPESFWGSMAREHRLALALFVGMNLANSANPVIARVLMDLGLLDKEIGTVVMTATIVDDLINWTLFAIVLGQIDPARAQSATDLWSSIGLVLAFFVIVLATGRWAGPALLHWLRTRVSWPTSFIATTAVAVLVCSFVAERLGVHAFLGAFLVGAALGGIEKDRHEARDAVTHFALSFFAPIYFVSMGMNTDFIANFDLLLVLVVVIVAFASKMGSVLLGARLAGMRLDRETLAIAFALNARGATGIILAGVGREHGVIDDRLFVAIVVMALVTSFASGPAIRALLRLSPATSRSSLVAAARSPSRSNA